LFLLISELINKIKEPPIDNPAIVEIVKNEDDFVLSRNL